VLNVAVPQVRLQRPGVLAVVRQLVAAGMPANVRVSLETKLGHLAGPLYLAQIEKNAGRIKVQRVLQPA